MPMVSLSLRVQIMSREVYEPFAIHYRVGQWPILGDLSSAGRVVAAPGRFVGKTSWPSPQKLHLYPAGQTSQLLGDH